MKPKFSDLITYINKALTGNDWNTNWQKIVNWLTLGTYDLKVNKIETNEIENSGTFTQNGDLIADNVQANTVTANSFVGDGSQLENIKVENIFSYTPFSINSAKANFIVNGGTKLTFNVDDGTLHQPLIVTTANGKQITITSINDYDVSGLNGTYYIFVDEETNGGTVYLKTCEIFRQDTEPTGQNGDIWFDVSNEPFVCREKVSNNWYSDEYNKIPIGKVVVTGGTITDLTILPFNDNGTNVVLLQSYRNGKSWYRIYSNGYVEQGGFVARNGTTTTVNLLVEYADTDYFVSATGTRASSGSDGYNCVVLTNTITTTSFGLSIGSEFPSMYWFSCGFRG